MLLERLGDVHRLLARHRVEDEEDVERLDGVANARELVHQRLVDVEPAGRVDDDDVETVRLRALEAFRRGPDGILRVRAIDGNRDLLAELLELVDRGGPLQVGRDEARLLALPPQVERELGGVRRLARALQPGHQDHGRRPPEGELGVPGAHQLREAVVHELDDLLAGVEALEDVLPEGRGLHPGDEVLDDLEVDVGLEQREADLAHRLVDCVLVQPPGAAEIAQGRLEPVGESVEHGREVYGRPPACEERGPYEASALLAWPMATMWPPIRSIMSMSAANRLCNGSIRYESGSFTPCRRAPRASAISTKLSAASGVCQPRRR